MLISGLVILPPTEVVAAPPGLDGVISPDEYEHSQELEPDTFWVHWSIVDDSIIMGLRANTTGWLALAFDTIYPTADLDVIFGRVVNGTETETRDVRADRDWEVVSDDTEMATGTHDIMDATGSETAGFTTIEFHRKLYTGDEVGDHDLPAVGEVLVEWYIGADDNWTKDPDKQGKDMIVIGGTEPYPDTSRIDGVVSSGEYDHTLMWGFGDFILYWRVDGPYITFAMEGWTPGWLAVGFDPEGTMAGADLVVAYVTDDGYTRIRDLKAVNETGPHLQDFEGNGTFDIFAWDGSYSHELTTVEFVRELNTGDHMDKPIPMGELNIVWATGRLDDWDMEPSKSGNATIDITDGVPDYPLEAFITYPEGDYDIGSTVTATVHVFLEGEYHDPEHVNLTRQGLQTHDVREIPLTRVSVGRYEGTFTIQEDDVLRILNEVWLEAYFYGRAAQMHFTMSFIPIPESFHVDVHFPDPSDLYPEPGETVEFEINITNGGEPVYPDYIWAAITDPVWTGLTLNEVSKGFYEGEFDIPDYLVESFPTELVVEVEYNDGTADHGEYLDFHFPDTMFDIWVDQVSATMTGAEVDIYVIDRDNLPIEGANVSIVYGYEDDEGTGISSELAGRTNTYGRTAFQLDYQKLGEDEFSVHILGEVEVEGFTEQFRDSIRLREVPPYYYYAGTGNDFIVEGFPYHSLEPDATVTLDLNARNYAGPLVDQDIYVFISDANRIYVAGKFTTDSNGDFEVTFETSPYPDHGVIEPGAYVYMVTFIDGERYFLEDGIGWSYSQVEEIERNQNDDTYLSIESFEVGEPVEVWLHSAPADGATERATLAWIVGSMDDLESIPGVRLELMNRGESPGGVEIRGTWQEEEQAYLFNVIIPPFLDEGTDITFIGMVVFDPGTYLQTTRTAILEMVELVQPNLPPTVSITFPADGATVNGTVVFTGTAGDDGPRVSVLCNIDGADPVLPVGTEEWSFEVDTTKLASGDHTFEVWVMDVKNVLSIALLNFTVDQPPTVSITDHTDGDRYFDEVTFTGTSSDDLEVVGMDVRIDGGWTTSIIEITPEWTYKVHTKDMKTGDHTFEVWAQDGIGQTAYLKTTFRFEKVVEEQTSSSIPWWIVLFLALVAVIAILAIWVYRRNL